MSDIRRAKATAHEWTVGVEHDWIDLSYRPHGQGEDQAVWIRRDQVAAFWMDGSFLHVVLTGAQEPALMLPCDHLPRLMAALGIPEGP